MVLGLEIYLRRRHRSHVYALTSIPTPTSITVPNRPSYRRSPVLWYHMASEAAMIRAAVQLSLSHERTILSTLPGNSSSATLAETPATVTPSVRSSSPPTSSHSTTPAEHAPDSQPSLKVRKRPRALDSNWKAMRSAVGKPITKKKQQTMVKGNPSKKSQGDDSVSMFIKRRVGKTDELSKVVALDCEMVGIGSDGKEDALGRASVVNYSGDVLYDRFVRVRHQVTDYRTKWSGLTEKNCGPEAKDAVELWEVQKDVGSLIKGRVVVGHAVANDLKVLGLRHPGRDIRDTAEWFRIVWRKQEGRRGRGVALRVAVARVLGVEGFQDGEHDSCEDARAALMLYKKERVKWEREIRERGRGAGKAKLRKKR